MSVKRGRKPRLEENRKIETLLSNPISIIKCHSIKCEIRIKFTGKESNTYHNDSQLDEDTFVSRGEELRLVTGIVPEPEVVDAHGDICSADEIKKTAYRFMDRI